MTSHVTILAADTRGDVQPYVALALGVLDAGHDVTLAAGAEFRPLVDAHRVPFAPLRARPMVRHMLDDAWRAAQDTDAIVYHPATLAGPHLAERLGVPAYAAVPAPVLSPTRAFPAPGRFKRSRGALLNRASYRLSIAASACFRGTVNAWRDEVLDLPHAPHGTRHVAPDGTPLPKLYPYSEAVVPRPRDWGEDTIVTGYWPLPPAPGWTPDPALERFLAAGPAPVYVGLGGLPLPGMAAQVVDALRAAGVRGLLAGALGQGAADDMHAVGDVPHEWLFPRVAAVVHHGGAGSTGAGLRAGCPAVMVPQTGDQAFWARAVHARGASPRPLHDLAGLGAALAEALGSTISARAADLGRALRREDGVAVAVGRLGLSRRRAAA